jgi:hypothetical protein
MPLHPIADKAEVSVDFPDKVYVGNFGHHSQFDAYAEGDGVAIKLVRPDADRREVTIHLHHALFAGILDALAASLASRPALDEPHRVPLGEAAVRLCAALAPRPPSPP